MAIKKELREKLGIFYLLPHQELIINHIISNEERKKSTKLLAILPTASGKSICFMAPLVFLEGVMICIYPLLSLMADQEKRMNSLNLKAVIVKGGMERSEREEKINGLVEGKYKVMITNMEMMLTLLKDKRCETLWNAVTTIVIDEVHTALTWGDTFRPSYKELPTVIETIKPRHILAFTATMDDKSFSALKERVFLNEMPYLVKASADRANIFYHSIHTLKMEDDLLQITRRKEMKPSVVFAATRNETERLSLFLLDHSIKSLFYHAGLDKEERKRIEEKFSSSSDFVLVATNAYGMGVDKKNIRSVIHTYLPERVDDFLQESGRGGRDGKEAHSFVLWREKDSGVLKEVFSGGRCIRNGLLEKMGEETENESCTGCSACMKDFFVPSGEKEILKKMGRHLIRRKSALIKSLYKSSILHPLPPLRRWKRTEVEGAIEELGKSGYINQWRIFLSLTKKGKKRLFQLLHSK